VSLERGARVKGFYLLIRQLALLCLLVWQGSMAYGQGVKTLNELSKYASSDRTRVLIEGAKKEGELTLYYAHPIVQVMAEAYSKAYGIRVKSWRAGSEAIQQRVVMEQKAGKFEIDVLSNTALDTEAATKLKLLQEVDSPVHALLVDKALPLHHQWAAFNMDIYSLAYNTKLIKAEDLPKTYEDLWDPRWKGLLGMEADDSIWYGALMGELGESRGRAMFEKIMSINAPSIRKGHSLLSTLVASGEVALALDVYNWNPEQLKRKGAPIEVAWLQPALALPSAVAVMSKAPHPHAALLFYDFCLSEGQALVAQAGYMTTNTKFDTPYTSLKYKVIDPAFALSQQERWFKMYAELILKRSPSP
jgi:iron(III) transport system substrate-binding protein